MQRLVILFLLISTIALSHSGRTNSKGCHNNKKTGSYHCHNSKPKPIRKSQSSSRALFKSSSNSQFKCEGKTVCKQMLNCAEAKYYLKTCKLHSLDRDNDGIPCENLCG
jgi:hypothetical protein